MELMAKIKCKTLDGGLIQSNTYKTPKGNSYLFEKSAPTEIKDKEDIEYFLKCGNGDYFESVGPVKDVVKKVTETVKEKVKEAVTGEKKEVEKKPTVDKHTYKELKAMNSPEQKDLIMRLGGSNLRIPRLEEDKIKLIQKLESDLK